MAVRIIFFSVAIPITVRLAKRGNFCFARQNQRTDFSAGSAFRITLRALAALAKLQILFAGGVGKNLLRGTVSGGGVKNPVNAPGIGFGRFAFIGIIRLNGFINYAAVINFTAALVQQVKIIPVSAGLSNKITQSGIIIFSNIRNIRLFLPSISLLGSCQIIRFAFAIFG